MRGDGGRIGFGRTALYDSGMDLFGDVRKKNLSRTAPLAVRMRPRTLDEFVGQQHFLAPGKLLRRMLEADRLTSVIFYGPPGTGKTRSPNSSPTTRRAISNRSTPPASA